LWNCLRSVSCNVLNTRTSCAWPQDWPAHLVWAALVRAAVTCHQRRGDSDAVAHCLYQLLALDLAAPEWDAML